MAIKILVTGAAGQLGSVIVRRFGAAGHDVVALARQALDIADHDAVTRRVRAERPDAVINCAAYNAVDAAEDQPQAALDANAFGVRSLAHAAREAGAVFVHYSTDFVFRGDATVPYTEEDPPGPMSVYGSSKLLGEWFAAGAPSHYVLRVESLFGGANAKSSIDRIIDALVEGREARVFVDRVVSPSYVEDVAGATEAMLARGAPSGLYHCVNTGDTTWLGLAEEIARAAGVPPRLVPVKVADVAMGAARPTYCALSNAKLRALGIDMPPWQDAVGRYVGVRRGGGVPR
jgi:dTDP-4-dehydrorhamnose reductase